MELMRFESRSSRLPTAFTVAILAHVVVLLAFVGLEALPRWYAYRHPELRRPEPVKVVFFPPPKTPVSPPRTDVLSSENHRAQQPGGASGQTPALRVPATPKPAPAPTPRPQVEPPQPSTQNLIDQSVLERLRRIAAERGRERQAQAAQAAALQREQAAQPGFSQGAIAQAISRQGVGGGGHGSGEGSGNGGGSLDFDAKDFEWGPYGRQIYEIIKRNLEAVLRSQTIVPGIKGRTRLQFRIARDGKVTALVLLDGSTWAMLDEAAMASVELSNPLPHLPAAFPHEDVGVTFAYYFNIPIDPSNDRF